MPILLSQAATVTALRSVICAHFFGELIKILTTGPWGEFLILQVLGIHSR